MLVTSKQRNTDKGETTTKLKHGIHCSWLQETKLIVKLTYFGAEFETEYDFSTCFYIIS